MTFTAVSLVDPLDGSACILMPRDGVTVLSLDVAPSVRSVTEERVGGHGQIDNTLYLSAAAVTLSLRLWPPNSGLTTMEAFIDELNGFLNPSLRCNLVCSNDAWATSRQLNVRFDSRTAPVDNPVTIDVAVSWKAPMGIWQAPVSTVQVTNAFVTFSGGIAEISTGIGATTSGIPVLAGSSTGNPLALSAGNMTVPWIAKLYGPCTGPKFANDSVGLTLSFSDSLVLAAGAYVELNSLNHTALRNSDPNDSVLGNLNFSASDWWQLQPGNNSLRYYPTSASAGAVAQITFQTAWMT